jgi:hypothetical protein
MTPKPRNATFAIVVLPGNTEALAGLARRLSLNRQAGASTFLERVPH